MRVLDAAEIAGAVARLCVRANTALPKDVQARIRDMAAAEDWPPAQEILQRVIDNFELAEQQGLPLCQDTGMACVFLEIGSDVYIAGDVNAAVDAGVRRGYAEGYLRKSVVADPLRRQNTGDNTPAMLTVDFVPGNQVAVTVAPKGFGSENMSRLQMLTPAQGMEGVRAFVVETARLAGANPCPPMVLGVGIGGTFERVAELAKEALVELREGVHPDPFYAKLEEDLLEAVNSLGIGPQGFGGRTTALAVRVKAYPTHIAGLPVAVNVGCHVTRHASEWI